MAAQTATVLCNAIFWQLRGAGCQAQILMERVNTIVSESMANSTATNFTELAG